METFSLSQVVTGQHIRATIVILHSLILYFSREFLHLGILIIWVCSLLILYFQCPNQQTLSCQHRKIGYYDLADFKEALKLAFHMNWNSIFCGNIDVSWWYDNFMKVIEECIPHDDIAYMKSQFYCTLQVSNHISQEWIKKICCDSSGCKLGKWKCYIVLWKCPKPWIQASVWLRDDSSLHYLAPPQMPEVG